MFTHNELKDSLGYMRSCCKKTERERGEQRREGEAKGKNANRCV